MRETASRREGADFSSSAQRTEQNATHVFNMSIHGVCIISGETKVFNRLRERYVTNRDGHGEGGGGGGVKAWDGLT